MLVFYFTSAEFGLNDLENKYLKVSDFSNLNDPFELLGVEMSDKDVRSALKFEKSLIAKTKGLLCFSENKYDPVQWAHYADNHRGLCLGFEIPEQRLKKVRYVSSRLAKSVLDEPDKQEKILTTKFKHWEYEKERRMILDLKDGVRVNGLIFKEFSPEMVLKEIYIGCRSSLTFSDIQKKFRSEKESVTVKHTRPAFKEFKIVWDRKKKSAHA
jgi:hypothetical protein